MKSPAEAIALASADPACAHRRRRAELHAHLSIPEKPKQLSAATQRELHLAGLLGRLDRGEPVPSVVNFGVLIERLKARG